MTSKRKGAKTSSTETTSSSPLARTRQTEKSISTSSSSEDLQTCLPTDSGFNSACAQCRKSHKACVGGIPCERCKRLSYECAAVPKKRRGRPPKNSSVGSKRSRKSSNSSSKAPPAKRKKTSSTAAASAKRRRPSPVSSPESCNDWSSAEETNDEEDEAFVEPDEEDEDFQLDDEDDQVSNDSAVEASASSDTQTPSPTVTFPPKQELIFPPKTPAVVATKNELIEQPIKSNKSSEEPNVVFRRSPITTTAAPTAVRNVKLDSQATQHQQIAAASIVESGNGFAKVTMNHVLMEVKKCGQHQSVQYPGNYQQEVSSSPSSFVVSSSPTSYHQTTTSCSNSPSRPKSYDPTPSHYLHRVNAFHLDSNFLPSQEASPTVSAIGTSANASSSHRLPAQEAGNHREAGYYQQQQQYHLQQHPASYRHHQQQQQPLSGTQRGSTFITASSPSCSSCYSGSSTDSTPTPSSPYVYPRGGSDTSPAATAFYPSTPQRRTFDAEFGSQPRTPSYSLHPFLPSIRDLFGTSFMDAYHPQRARNVTSSHKE